MMTSSAHILKKKVIRLVKLELETSTLAILVAGMYCANSGIDSMAVPQSVWMQIAEKLEYFLSNELWDFKKMSFEDWVNTSLFIAPKPMLSDEDIKELQEIPLYFEAVNGNIILCVSMNIKEING